MTAERDGEGLPALGVRHGLGAEQVRSLELLREALEGNDHAPTSAAAAEQALEVHLADSLVALELGVLEGVETVADIGAGAGFPGFPLAVALPGSAFRLVESQARRCRFMQELAGTAGIANAEVVCARAESWEEGLGANDAVLARALAPQPVVLEYAAPLLRTGGILLDWRGRRAHEEEAASRAAAIELGLALVEIRPVTPFPGSRDRHLHVFSKVADTPPRFPRRPGMARKRPLGG
jgi:16S rRNA (guanine527-N7)-methyltransferase